MWLRLRMAGLQLGRPIRRIVVVAAGEGTADAQQALGDGAVQLQGGVGVQIGGQGELQLLQLQLLAFDLLHGVSASLPLYTVATVWPLPTRSPSLTSWRTVPLSPERTSSSRTSQPLTSMMSSAEL